MVSLYNLYPRITHSRAVRGLGRRGRTRGTAARPRRGGAGSGVSGSGVRGRHTATGHDAIHVTHQSNAVVDSPLDARPRGPSPRSRASHPHPHPASSIEDLHGFPRPVRDARSAHAAGSPHVRRVTARRKARKTEIVTTVACVPWAVRGGDGPPPLNQASTAALVAGAALDGAIQRRAAP